MSSAGVAEYLNMKVKEENGGDWEVMQQYYCKKLWHQLTIKLTEYMKKPELLEAELTDIYENFISTFEIKINPYALVQIIEIITKKLEKNMDAMRMLRHIELKVKHSYDAESLCKVLQGQIYLQINDLPAAEKIVRSFQEEDGVTPVQGRIYKLAADYYMITNQPTKYYRAAIQYVACDESTLIDADLAKSLAIAAVVSKDIYELNELLVHPIMECLKGHRDEWAVRLLEVVAIGDLSGYTDLKKFLVPNDSVDEDIKTKVRILCIIEMASKCPVAKRVLKIADIANETHYDPNNVEFLIMKAMSKNLIQGKIDEVNQAVIIKWIRPRALTLEKIEGLIRKVDVWRGVVGDVINDVESNMGDILV